MQLNLFCDSHCDTLLRILGNGQDLLQNDGQLDLQRLMQGGCALQFFAVFIQPEQEVRGIANTLEMLDKFYIELNKNRDKLHPVFSASDVDIARQQNKVGALLSIEGAGAIQGNLAALRMFHRLGVRAMTLTWNGDNALCGGIGDNASGLTQLGREAVALMNDIGMIVDVSHISEAGFWDTAQVAKKPFIASHSNAKSLCSHKRNLTDQQILEIVKRGGYIGLNLYSDFLCDDGVATMQDVVRHAEHMLSLDASSARAIGIGADLDGVDKLPGDMSGVQHMYMVREAFAKAGYSEQLINDIMCENLRNFLRGNLTGGAYAEV